MISKVHSSADTSVFKTPSPSTLNPEARITKAYEVDSGLLGPESGLVTDSDTLGCIFYFSVLVAMRWNGRAVFLGEGENKGKGGKELVMGTCAQWAGCAALPAGWGFLRCTL
jgi:hypothetical protein